jgi:nucleolar protein 56
MRKVLEALALEEDSDDEEIVDVPALEPQKLEKEKGKKRKRKSEAMDVDPEVERKGSPSKKRKKEKGDKEHKKEKKEKKEGVNVDGLVCTQF